MKFRNIFVSLLAAAAALVSCSRETESLGLPSIRFGQESLTFTKDGGTAKINVTVSRDWTADTEEDWLGISRTSGTGSSKSQEIEISVLPNDGYNRQATVNFVVGKKLITKAYTIYQDGPEGDAPIEGIYYDYSLKSDGQGEWTTKDVLLPEGAQAIWVYDSRYGMKATAYINSQNYASESWLITPEIELAPSEHNYVHFLHAGQYFGNIAQEATFWIADASTEADEDWKQLTVKNYPTSWTFVDSGLMDISEYGGRKVKFGFKYTSTASKAGTWEVDELTITTNGSSDDNPDQSGDPVAEGVIYYENFDKEAATQTYGSGSSWPYLDQFEGWKNAAGSGAAGVDYAFSGTSARANSASNANYSDYAGSGVNNIFFGANSYLNIKNIKLGGQTNLTLTFGSEKYLNQGSSVFDKEEFKVYVSNTGEGASWVSLDYDFAKGSMPEARWDLASSSFTVPSGTETLYLYFAPSVASAYRLDDVTIAASQSAGTAVDFSKGVDLGTSGEVEDQSNDPQPQPVDGDVVYGNNFDKAAATQTYGSGTSWPYLDQFDGWQNETGSGVADVEYEFKAMSARANSASNSQYSLYGGSGANNLFFGASSHFQVRKIALGGATSFALTFGSEKYLGSGSSVFSKDEFKVYVSDTAGGASWVSLDYDFAQGAMPEGKWDIATAHFTVPQGTKWLNIYIVPSVASAYRIDDLTLTSEAASATSQSVDFGRGIDLGTTAIDGQGGGDEQSADPSDEPQPSGDEFVVFEESFYDSPGVFFTEDVTLPDGLEYVWSHDANYHYMKASAYKDGAKEAESWLIMEEPMDFSNINSARMTFDHTGKFFSKPAEEAIVCASTDMEEWVELDVPGWFSNSDWTFVSSGNVDLSEFAGEEQVYIAFVYTSTSTAAGTWEIKNLKVYGSAQGGQSNPSTDPVNPSTDPSTNPSTDPSTNPSTDPSVNPDNTVTLTVEQDYLAANPTTGTLNGMVMYSNDTDYGNNVPTELRIYKGKSLTLSANVKIVKVEMVHTANNGTKGGNDETNQVETDPGVAYTLTAPETSKESVIDIPGGSTTVKLTATQNQIRITKLSVTYIAQ
ncbi:MAG: BACON domain-containing protein [Bacteroidales bacterium]|nr:BACON domain-containing protein [Bacteroidales bacterium]